MAHVIAVAGKGGVGKTTFCPACACRLSALHASFYRSTACRTGDQRFKTLAESRSSFLSAFRVCQSCRPSLSHLADRILSQANGRLLVHVPHDADSAPHRRSGRFQQLKYRDHHSRNRCHSDFRFQSTLHAVRRARQCRHRFYRSLSRRRKLPSGTSRYLA